MLLPVIMAGGSGTRLWPMSRSLYPKQFLPLLSDKTMLQETCARLEGVDHGLPIVVAGAEHRFIVAEQLRVSDCKTSAIILEPEGRNTAPAVALAALQALNAVGGESDPLLLVLAADHAISDVPAFQWALQSAIEYAEAGQLVTFGIQPNKPETGYGYIRCGEQQGAGRGMAVAEFVEKPDLDTAESYLASGNYLWNSGMFLFKASRYLAELQQHRADIYSACEAALRGAKNDYDFVWPAADHFANCPSDSIDYAVMEKTRDAVVIPMECGWSDVGSWAALWEVSEKDDSGNTLKGDVVALGSRNSYIQSHSKFVAAVGLDNVVIVESDDAIMVAAKDQVQDIKNVVAGLVKSGRSEARLHRKVYRPWGYYDSIDMGSRFQVKRIMVKPGAAISLQMHHHRAEHWIVVTGTAYVTKGEESFILSENQSTYIPIGVTHRLENRGSIPLEIIEVQSGSYLGEDDIVRFEDVYGRS